MWALVWLSQTCLDMLTVPSACMQLWLGSLLAISWPLAHLFWHVPRRATLHTMPCKDIQASHPPHHIWRKRGVLKSQCVGHADRSLAAKHLQEEGPWVVSGGLSSHLVLVRGRGDFAWPIKARHLAVFSMALSLIGPFCMTFCCSGDT